MKPDTSAAYVDRPHWLDRALRLGPLQYSALGPRLLERPPAELAGWLVDFLDRTWEEQGRPDPFTAVVVSGDDGSLARTVLGLGPACLTALRYVLVDPYGPAETAARLLALEDPAFLFPSARRAAGAPDDFDVDSDDPLPPAAGIGPMATYLTGMPAVSTAEAAVAIAAVGVLSRAESDRVEWRDGRWLEIRVAAAAGPAGAAAVGEELVEIAVPLAPGSAPAVPPRPDPPADGSRYAVLTGAVAWLKGALRSAPGGVLAAVDRWTVATEPIGRSDPGTAVALDQLRRVREPLGGPDPVLGELSVVCWRVG